MHRLLAALFFFAVQTAPQPMGVVTGVVRGANAAPASGVRVYAIGVQDGVEVNASAPLEGLTQTDASGRYRIEVAPGRYYIGSGSVNSPTFYPGTTSVAGARVVTVTPGGIIEGIDFSSFVPASSRTGILASIALTVNTAALSGTVRYPDGTPATGITVSAVPASMILGGLAPSPTATPAGVLATLATVRSVTRSSGTDLTGRYFIQNLPVDTFYIAAGFAESPTLYPGVSDVLIAKTITTTSTTNLNNLDFTVPRPPAGVVVSGRVTGIGDAPAGGSAVSLQSRSPAPSAYGLPTSKPNRVLNAGGDGRFEFTNVLPGAYDVHVLTSGLRAESRSITVGDQPVTGLNFSIRAAVLSGRILGENGSVLPDVRLFVDALVSTVRNPNMITSTIMPISNEGSFSRILEAEEYRFYLRVLPEEYAIQSITSGGVDLMKETLKFRATGPVNVEVRVKKRDLSMDTGTVSVRGRIVDAVTGAPAPAERIFLCCRDSGPSTRFSAPLNADGAFEFTSIPPGRYDIALQTRPGSSNLSVSGRGIDVGNQNISGLELVSASQMGELAAGIVVEAGLPSSADFAKMSVVFTGTNGRVRETASRAPDGTYRVLLPAGDRYTVSVLNVPEGLVVKSIVGSTEVPSLAINAVQPLPFPNPAPPALIIVATPNRIVITLAPKPQ
jgi:5-hydroxyisourate hydrolase-like protein (transthyretin family)